MKILGGEGGVRPVRLSLNPRLLHVPALRPIRFHKVIVTFIIIFNIIMTLTLLSFEFTAITRTHEIGNYVIFGGTSPF